MYKFGVAVVVVFVVSIALMAFVVSASPTTSTSTTRAKWELISEPDLTAGRHNPFKPTKRYSHAMCVAGEDDIVVAYGYHFDHARLRTTWLSDVWAFDVHSHNWKSVHRHDHQSQKRPADNTIMGPRYKLTAVAAQKALWFFGGDDGGLRGKAVTHVWGAYHDDLWKFDEDGYHKVETLRSADGATPQARGGHTAVVTLDGEEMIVFGGLVASKTTTLDNRFLRDMNDVFSFHFKTLTWHRPHDGVVSDAPPPRRSHGAGLISPNLMIIFGGFSMNATRRNMVDTWLFDLRENTWEEVKTPTQPPPRGGMAAAASATHGVLIVHGGAECVMSCVCKSDTWMFRLATREWVEVLPVKLAPVPRYFHQAVFHETTTSVYLFGGESYKPYAYWNDLWRLDLRDLLLSGENGGNRTKPIIKDALQEVQFHKDSVGLPKAMMEKTRDEDLSAGASAHHVVPSTTKSKGEVLSLFRAPKDIVLNTHTSQAAPFSISTSVVFFGLVFAVVLVACRGKRHRGRR